MGVAFRELKIVYTRCLRDQRNCCLQLDKKKFASLIKVSTTRGIRQRINWFSLWCFMNIYIYILFISAPFPTNELDNLPLFEIFPSAETEIHRYHDNELSETREWTFAVVHFRSGVINSIYEMFCSWCEAKTRHNRSTILDVAAFSHSPSSSYFSYFVTSFLEKK